MANTQDTGKFRTNIKDQFYTNERVAKQCIAEILRLVPSISQYVWIEPSAGKGSFLHNIPSTFDKIGLDVDPKSPDIQTQDYLTWNPTSSKPIVVFGNPPFGRQSSLAKAFIRKSCQFASVIAFILPKSFTKPSMNNAFDSLFHCIHSVELERNAFVLNDSDYDVPCVFQIWQKKSHPRVLEAPILPSKFTYTKCNQPYDIAFRRVGGLAGKCYINDGTHYSIQSHYFIKFDDDIVSHLPAIITKINDHPFPSNTVGPRSLSKNEVNEVLNSIVSSETLGATTESRVG
jgi:hypothetical protein